MSNIPRVISLSDVADRLKEIDKMRGEHVQLRVTFVGGWWHASLHDARGEEILSSDHTTDLEEVVNRVLHLGSAVRGWKMSTSAYALSIAQRGET